MRSEKLTMWTRPARWSVAGAAVVGVLLAAGCSNSVRVQVDTRLTPDTSMWPRLDGPRYVIHGPDPAAEAGLGFEGLAAVLQRALDAERPSLHRVPTSEVANLIVGMQVEVIDRGMGVQSYPVYGQVYGYRRYGPCGPGYAYSGTYYAGDRVESYHLGFLCRLSVSAWILDQGSPVGRKVLWECSTSAVSEDPHPEAMMPYLAVALAQFYGTGTEGTETVKLGHNDERVLVAAGTPPEAGPSEHHSRDRKRRASTQPAHDSQD